MYLETYLVSRTFLLVQPRASISATSARLDTFFFSARTTSTPLSPLRQHTSAYVSIRQHMSAYVSAHHFHAAQPAASAYVSIRQHTSAYAEYVSICQHTSAPTTSTPLSPLSQHTSALVSIRRHTSAYLSIRRSHYLRASRMASRRHT
jgi:hypothetical protein